MNNSYFDYLKTLQEKQELDHWKDQTILEIKAYIDSRLTEIKNDIINGINHQNDIYVETYLNGKKTDFKENITKYVIGEITKSFE